MRGGERHILYLCTLYSTRSSRYISFLFFYLSLYQFFSPQFRGIQLVVVTVLSHRCNSRTDSGEAKVESHASSETQPDLAALLLDTTHIQPGSQPHQCVGGNTVHLATWSACTAPSPPQELLVCDETRISLLAKPSLTRTTLGQLCVAPRTSRSWPAATEPGREPRVSGGTASAAMQCLRPLWHPGGPSRSFSSNEYLVTTQSVMVNTQCYCGIIVKIKSLFSGGNMFLFTMRWKRCDHSNRGTLLVAVAVSVWGWWLNQNSATANSQQNPRFHRLSLVVLFSSSVSQCCCAEF